VVVVVIGILKLHGAGDGDGAAPSRGWAGIYWGLAAVMAVGAALILLLAKPISHNLGTHRTFIVEAWLIFWLAVFWLVQTWDRRKEGAPPRTNQERQLTRTATPKDTKDLAPSAGGTAEPATP
jgi:ABC-type nickel/cobalt efflux system permease component RcnA